jgi:hypothetical protein
MSTSHLPRDKKDRSVRPRKHDPYKAKGKLQGTSVCRECQAVYHKGRWMWGPVPSDSQEVVCPACERIRDHAPSGVLLLTGEIVVRHRDQVLGLARNEETRLKAEHPLARGVVITTTDPHLARHIGEALHHAYRGTLTCRYEENEDLLRANWES